MSSASDLTFSLPWEGLRGVETSRSANAGTHSHLHLSGNPDWIPAFSASNRAAVMRRAHAPPLPLAIDAPVARPLAAPAAIDAPTATPVLKGNFFTWFCRTARDGAGAVVPSAVTDASLPQNTPLTAIPTPPKALNAYDAAPHMALPVDSQLPSHTSQQTTVEASGSSAPRRQPPRPLAVGSDTWNALSSVSFPPKPSAMARKVLTPPVAIDTASSRAPKPLWSDISFVSCFRSSAPTLEAFRNGPPAALGSTPPDSPLRLPVSSATAATALRMPVPPKPITTSPLRDDAAGIPDAATTRPMMNLHHESKAIRVHPLIPVGEGEVLRTTPLLKPAQETAPLLIKSPTLTATIAPADATLCMCGDATSLKSEYNEMDKMWLPSRVEPVAPQLPDFVKSVTEPTTSSAQQENASAAANARNFVRTLFSRSTDEEAETTSTKGHTEKVNDFNALEIATNRRQTPQSKPSQPVDYSTFFNSSFFDDDGDEDSEESLEKLRRVVSIVMQSAKANEATSSSTSQPASQSRRREESGFTSGLAASFPFTSKYTESSNFFQTGATSSNSHGGEWVRYAHF